MYQLALSFVLFFSSLVFAENPESYQVEKITLRIKESITQEKNFSKKIAALNREHKKLEKMISSYEKTTDSDLLKELQSLMALEEVLSRLNLKEKSSEACANAKSEIEYADNTASPDSGAKKTKSPETVLGLQLLENICSK